MDRPPVGTVEFGGAEIASISMESAEVVLKGVSREARRRKKKHQPGRQMSQEEGKVGCVLMFLMLADSHP